nr:arabinosyltransferase domain-containing protein [Nocardia puris]
MADTTMVRAEQPSTADSGAGTAQRDSGAWARPVALLAALIGALCAVAMPFLPVRVDAATISWPQHGAVTGVQAPLVAYAPVSLSAQVPCIALTELAATGGVAVSTIPRQAPDRERYGFVVKVVADSGDGPGRVDVVSRGTLLWSAPLDAVRGQQCDLAIALTPTGSTVEVSGLGNEGATRTDDLRPQVVGVFSELTGGAPEGLRVDIEADSRYSSSPTPLKLVVLALCLLATLVSLVALHRLDRVDGRVNRRFLPARWWRLGPVDWVVFATLAVWHFIGANTSDDGYILGMARGTHSSGTMSNYYRWFSVDEGPFYTPYTDVIAWLAHVSAVSPWVRLPTTVLALLTWWVISREVLPRLGAAVRGGLAQWTAALVFLAFWLPYNNGLRAEPFVAAGVIFTWVTVERAIATRRLLPFAVAIIIAAFTLTAAPSGLIAALALVAGARTLAAVIVARAKTVGYAAQLLPLGAAGLVVLTVVFADRTLAGVREMFAVHAQIKPGESWFLEFLRYQFLLQPSGDGWLTRRFGVFLMLLCLVVCVVVLLRKGGRIPGVASGPTVRMLGITFGAMAVLMFAPTKWNHQFGVFAGLAACVAAVAAVAVGPGVLRSARNRALLAAAVFFVMAMTFVGSNGYWYVSAWGIPWWDKPPTFAGFGLSTFAFGAAVLALAAAAVFHISPWRPTSGAVSGFVSRIPILAVVAAAMVLFEVGSFVKGAVAQYPAYSLAKSNVAAAFSGGCGLADDVLVETDPNASMLRPLDQDVAVALAGTESTGFDPNGVAPVLESDEVESTTGRANSVSSDKDDLRDAARDAGSESDTSQGVGINGSTVALPFGLDPATTPVLGSYRDGAQTPAALTTGWYGLPAAVDGSRGDIIAIAAAGRIKSVDADGIVRPGQDLVLEYGAVNLAGGVDVLGSTVPLDIGPSPMWRNLRVPLDVLPERADVVRLVAQDLDLGGDQWLAVTPPRVPRTTTLTDLVGSETPVLMDWAVGMNFPCQNHLPTRNGISDLPAYRILPDRNGATITNMWQGHDGGGPLGWTQLLFTARTLPAYLNHDWDRDWGSLEQYIPLDPSAGTAEVRIDPTQRWGTWTPGPIITSY